MKNLKKIVTILFLAILSVFTVSCNRDESPVEPKNENLEKGHDNWTKVEIIVREGHLHGAMFHSNPFYDDVYPDDGVVFLPKEQKVIFEQDNKGNVTRREDANVRVKSTGANGKKEYEVYYVQRDPMHPIEVITGTELDAKGQPASARYSMEIIYYNGEERINTQFVTPNQIQYHQHFFTTKSYTNWLTKELVNNNRNFGDELFKYIYRDTDPEDVMIASGRNSGSKLRLDGDGVQNPVGLKGYFYFAKNQVKFDMKVSLAHLYVSKRQGGVYSLGNNPSMEMLLNGTTDFVQDIPFIVVGNKDNTKEFVESMMKYYNITEDAVYDYIFADAIGSAESSNFWL